MRAILLSAVLFAAAGGALASDACPDTHEPCGNFCCPK